jgi:ABC-2 type transport system ATP-binding protein
MSNVISGRPSTPQGWAPVEGSSRRRWNKGAAISNASVKPLQSEPEAAVEAVRLSKDFGRTRAVDGLNLSVPAGSVYGLLGPNGAGKTTAIRMLATLLLPDSGTARVFGHDVVRDADAVRGRVSLTGQFASVDDDLTGRENLVLLARLLGHPRREAYARAGELLSAFDLSDAAGRLVRTYSGGMRRRLDVAASIVVTSDLLFLDEPTTGLDPHSRNQVWRLVRTLVAQGTTVLLTTQNLDEADHLADRIAVLKEGKVMAEGTPAQLKASVGSGVLQVNLRDPAARPIAVRLLEEFLGMKALLASDPRALSIRVADSSRAGRALLELSRSKVAVDEFSLSQPSLDEVFLTLTGHPTKNFADEEVSA